jgi:predicted  nucleic acid-binding Zn-ribbon protein
MYNINNQKRKGEYRMEDINIILERHTQKLNTMERDISDLKAIQTEIRTMNETLVVLANELKHTNEHLACHDKKILSIEKEPHLHRQQIITAIASALAGGIATTLASLFGVW